jgi:hypothetical protein
LRNVQVGEEVFVNIRIGHIRFDNLRVESQPDTCEGRTWETSEEALQG